MPTYEYRCEKGHEFEAFQKMSDPPLGECPECGAPAVRKISSGAGLVFKGTGFYITDYKKPGEKKKAEAAKKKKSEGGSGESGGKSGKSGGDGGSGSGGSGSGGSGSSGGSSSGSSGSGGSGTSSGGSAGSD